MSIQFHPKGVKLDEKLAKKYGKPLVVDKKIFVEKPFDPIAEPNKRWGEVVFIVRRPNDKLLTVGKDWYPNGVHRFPSGGINYGEKVEAALLRELKEELGLEIPVERFLAVINYRFDDQKGFVGHYSSFVFLFPEVKKELKFLDTNEGEVTLVDMTIEEVEGEVKKLKKVGGEMKDWALFRSVLLETVFPLLKEPKS